MRLIALLILKGLFHIIIIPRFKLETLFLCHHMFYVYYMFTAHLNDDYEYYDEYVENHTSSGSAADLHQCSGRVQ